MAFLRADPAEAGARGGSSRRTDRRESARRSWAGSSRPPKRSASSKPVIRSSPSPPLPPVRHLIPPCPLRRLRFAAGPHARDGRLIRRHPPARAPEISGLAMPLAALGRKILTFAPPSLPRPRPMPKRRPPGGRARDAAAPVGRRGSRHGGTFRSVPGAERPRYPHSGRGPGNAATIPTLPRWAFIGPPPRSGVSGV
jgi:hypothetical protein